MTGHRAAGASPTNLGPFSGHFDEALFVVNAGKAYATFVAGDYRPNFHFDIAEECIAGDDLVKRRSRHASDHLFWVEQKPPNGIDRRLYVEALLESYGHCRTLGDQ